MAKDTNEILMRYPEYIRDVDLFMKALRMTDSISGWRARRRATKKPGVIVSPAGMLKGGNAVFYMNSIARKEKNAIFLISYQVPDSPGRRLLDTKKFILGGKARNVQAEVEQFDFTSHSGKTQLIETVKKIDSNGKIFVVHGAEGNCNKLVEIINDDFGLEAVAPSSGEVFKI
jgi:putative mRNA 3-end processing factor